MSIRCLDPAEAIGLGGGAAHEGALIAKRLARVFCSGQRYSGRHFWARGYFCSTAGNITETSYFNTWRSTDATLSAPAGSGSLNFIGASKKCGQ
jgi:hypothetical protein